MEGSLGSLIVKIGTDLSSLNSGLKEAQDKVKETSGKISEVVNKVGTTMTVAGAAITGAFGLMIKSTLDYADALYDTSERTGIAVDTLSELKYVAEQTESSFEAVSTGLKFLSKNIYEASQGTKEASEGFLKLGISIDDEVTGKLITADEALFKVADKFKLMTDDTLKTGLAMQLFGRQGASLIPILNLGSDGIKKLSEETHRMGIVLTAENAKSFDRFSDSLKTAQAAMSGLWMNISLLVLPTLQKLITDVTNVIVRVREWSEANPVLSSNITNVTLALGALMLVLGPMLLIFNQMIQAILVLKVLFPGLAASVGTLAAVLNTLGAAAIAAFIGWEVGKKIGEVTGLSKAFEDMFTKMFEWLDRNEQKARSILRVLSAIATLGLSEVIKDKGVKTTTSKTAETSEIASSVAQEQPQTIEAEKSFTEQRLQVQREYYAMLHELNLTGAEQQFSVEEQTLQQKEMMENEAMQNRLRRLLEYGDIEISQRKKIEAMISTLKQQRLAEEELVIKKKIGLYDDYFKTNLSKLAVYLEQAGQQNKGAALAQQVINIALATMDTAAGIARAFREYKWPASLAVAALVGAAGAVQIATISGVALAEGGIVTKPTYALMGEAGPEAVIPLKDNTYMGNTTINIEVKAQVNNNMDVEKLAEQLGYKIDQELQNIRGS